ncbi:hypothetical protein DEA8626_00606 [Defluviimonas aquaemixtae]|uniref:Uncharacterized protein n=1 Tax=Albidovulum aquaemixtae TaxID=1542388 RepID=A0A2R8B3D4_9RHOB|nr:hypothetical protein [Defluviimonas aquaemixtae]SPH17092.1 hypothetical protein DEA8626_00606 [Defluviimonas aquaemixtae]
MFRLAPLSFALALSACVTGSKPEPVGSVTVNNVTYPIEALSDGTWRVRVDGKPVVCAHATLEACFWSARHHLTARELLDDLG